MLQASLAWHARRFGDAIHHNRLVEQHCDAKKSRHRSLELLVTALCHGPERCLCEGPSALRIRHPTAPLPYYAWAASQHAWTARKKPMEVRVAPATTSMPSMVWASTTAGIRTFSIAGTPT